MKENACSPVLSAAKLPRILVTSPGEDPAPAPAPGPAPAPSLDTWAPEIPFENLTAEHGAGPPGEIMQGHNLGEPLRICGQSSKYL